MNRRSGKMAKLVGIGLAALLLVVLFGYQDALGISNFPLLSANKALDATWQLALDFLRISLIAFLFAGLLAPLEALGWWAGWYGDEVNTNLDPGKLVEPLPANSQVSRYVIYLDGIAQSKYEYLQDAEIFLNELAAVLPEDILIVKGIMPYSVINRPLTEARILSFFWRIADYFQGSRSGGIIGFLIAVTIQLRNLIIVALSADQRYGPIYNQGTAQVMYNSLINHGYQPGSGTPITLVGYSGGAQISLAAAPYLKRALAAPIDAISISGVFSGNNNVLKLEHFYHLVGDKDVMERLGPILFAKRWKLFFLSYWNRAKRRGKVTITSLGPVGHNDTGGPFDCHKRLPDGRTYLQQTVDWVAGIIQGNSPLNQVKIPGKTSNYERYWEAPFNRPNYYPLDQSVDPELYRAIAPWMGRLILPTLGQRRYVKGVLFEVHHAPSAYQHLVGQIVQLTWNHTPKVKKYLQEVIKDLHFSEEATYSQRQGFVHPYRLDHWRQIDPLESLAGSRPHDDVIVSLKDPIIVVEVRETLTTSPHPPIPPSHTVATLQIESEPVQITGRFYALVKILQPIEEDSEQFRVVHFNRTSRQFDGVEEIVRIPQVVADMNGVFPSTSRDIEKSAPNVLGWYIYGAKNRSGMFVVQAIAPRSVLRLQPEGVIFGKTATWNYFKKYAWQVEGDKGHTKSVLLVPKVAEEQGSNLTSSPIQDAISQWQEGDRALVMHMYGGIGGKKREPAASTPIFFGHFAYGEARVVREPLADELIFEIEYYQVYTHNVDGIIAGTLAWNRFLGDRQFGWMGTRPTWDILIKFDAVTEDFNIKGVKRSVLDILAEQLEIMTARYRIGDGTGGTYVGPANNCSQDSNQAIYTAIKFVRDSLILYPQLVEWLTDDPGEPERFEQLLKLGKAIKQKLLPFGTARADWQENANTLGISPEEDFFQGLLMGLASWRTMLPRLACETITRQFLKQGAFVWVLHTNQVGGFDPDIEPIAPTQIGW